MNTMVNLEFVFKFQEKIMPSKAAIIRYLLEHDGKFYGSYRDFAEVLGKTKEYATNLHRMVHDLEEMGIVTTIVDKEVKRRCELKTLIGLNDNWLERI